MAGIVVEVDFLYGVFDLALLYRWREGTFFRSRSSEHLESTRDTEILGSSVGVPLLGWPTVRVLAAKLSTKFRGRNFAGVSSAGTCCQVLVQGRVGGMVPFSFIVIYKTSVRL